MKIKWVIFKRNGVAKFNPDSANDGRNVRHLDRLDIPVEVNLKGIIRARATTTNEIQQQRQRSLVARLQNGCVDCIQ